MVIIVEQIVVLEVVEKLAIGFHFLVPLKRLRVCFKFVEGMRGAVVVIFGN